MKHLVTLGLLASIALAAPAARADAPFTANRPQVGGFLAYGIYTGDDLGGSANPYGLGFGAMGGYTLDASVFLGGSLTYFLGASESYAGGDATVNILSFMLEPGYDLGLSPTMVLRPMLGVGLSSLSVEACLSGPAFPGAPAGGCIDNSESKFAIAPGARFLLDFDGVFGMAGLQYHHIFVENGNADGLLLGVGAGFAF